MFQNKAKKNLKRVRIAIENAINAQTHGMDAISGRLCKQYVLEQFDRLSTSKASINQCATYNSETDYEKVAYTLIYNLCERGLSSGSLNTYPGLLNPTGEAVYALFGNVLNRFKECYGLNEEGYRAELTAVKEAINTLG